MLSLINKYKHTIVVIIVGALLAAIFTFPVITSPSKIIFGYSGDNFGNIWYFWWQKHNLNSPVTNFYNAPAGVTIRASFSEFLWMLPGALLTNLTNEIFAFNTIIFAGFVLSFVFMYALVFYLTRNKYASFLGGMVYASSPYHYWQATAHLSLSLIFWLPLFVLSLFYFDRHKNLKSAFFVSAVFLSTIYTTFYYGFFCAIITVSFFLLKYIFDFKEYFKVRTFLLLIISAAIVLLGFVPLWMGLQSSKGDQSLGVTEAFSRKLDELVGLSARPWDYFIYPPNHPVFGRFNSQIYDYIQSKGNDFKVRSAYLPERVVFLEILNILLALFSVIALFRRNKHVSVVLFLLLISFVVSLPPYFPIRGITFYTPSYLLYQFFPFIRVYARMGVFVLLFTTILSSFALKTFFESNKNKFIKILLGGLIGLIFIFEFIPNFSAYTDLREVPQVYQWLKSQPGNFIIAEYPEAFDLQVGLIFQRIHGKQLFNMPSSEPRYGLWKEVADLTSTAYPVLKKEGVRYIVYHLTDLAYNPYDDWRFFRFAKTPTVKQERDIEIAGFKKVAQFPEAIVYGL